MAVNTIPNYNRLISLRFLTAKGVEIPNTRIECPVRGRKPKIEITGSFYTATELPAFNLTIKNLYLDVPNEQYPLLEVTAGYEGKLQTFTGSIVSLYQEGPGPESTTVIQCVTGNLQKWLGINLSLNYDAGYKVTDVLQKIASSVEMKLVASQNVKALTGKEALQLEETPQNALARISKTFSDQALVFSVRGKELHAYTKTDTTGANKVELKFLSAPPQQNAGSEGTVYATINAPWDPTLRVGDLLTFPSWQFMKRYGKAVENKTSIIVNSIQFHFGTIGSVNQMTVTGAAV